MDPVPGQFLMDQHLVSLLTPASLAAEQYRRLSNIAQEMQKETGLRVLAVSSAAVGDGKTITAINLAGALAQAAEGARVLLADADLRRGSVSTYLGLNERGARGLSDVVLNPDLSLDSVVRPSPPFNFCVLPAGTPRAAPYEVFRAARLRELLDEARQLYDYVILDAPPLVPVADCRALERCVDGFLLVVAAHKTPRRLFEEALNLIDPSKTVGLVFNRDDSPLSAYSSYGYGYAYGQPPGGTRARWWHRRRKPR